MSDNASASSAPFERFSFTLVANRRPRAHIRLAINDDGTYELHVEKGSASHPTSQFTRVVPRSTADRLNDGLQIIGVPSWEESYGDTTAPGSMRWNLNIVYKTDVFSQASKGGSDTPEGFSDLLEELYHLDFPRPDDASSSASHMSGAFGGDIRSALGMATSGATGEFGNATGLGGMFGAAGASGIDLSKLSEFLPEGAEGALDPEELEQFAKEMQHNPQALQERMRDEYAHMTPEERSRLLDGLAGLGIYSRSWWERWLGGNL